MRGVYDNFVSPKKAPPRKPVEACIRRDSFRSWCRREIGGNEFVFVDAERAVEIYADGAHLRACLGCVEQFRAEQKARGGRLP